jgi:hypothetical protein
MLLEQRPSALQWTRRLISLHLWATVVLGLMVTAAEGQVARRAKKAIDAGQAVGHLKGSRSNLKGWTVGFALVKPRDSTRPVGRAVTMDARGHNVRVEHVGFYLEGLEPRPD